MKQIIMRRSALYQGTHLTAGQTYSVDDETAAQFVALRYAVFGPLYDEASTAVLLARARSNGNPTIQFWTSDFGAKSVQIYVPAIAAGDVVVAGWSAALNDVSALGALIDAVCDDLEAATPAAVEITNVRVLPEAARWISFMWDGIAPIKTIGLVVCKLGALTGATSQRSICEIGF